MKSFKFADTEFIQFEVSRSSGKDDEKDNINLQLFDTQEFAKYIDGKKTSLALSALWVRYCEGLYDLDIFAKRLNVIQLPYKDIKHSNKTTRDEVQQNRGSLLTVIHKKKSMA